MNEDLSDITIVINGHKIPAHKFILSSRSDVFKDMFNEFKRSIEKVIEIKDTNVEAFKVFLKCIYFEEFDSKSIENYSLAIDVFKLSQRFQTQELSHFVEEELIELICVENCFAIHELALIYESKRLLITLKDFFIKNKTELIEKKLFLNHSFELIEKFIEFANLSLKELISVLIEIRQKFSDKDLSQFRKLINFDLCSMQTLNRLKNIGLFGDKELIEILMKRYEELNVKYIGLTADYQKAKLLFQPFISQSSKVTINGINYRKSILNFENDSTNNHFNFEFKF
jgi:ribosomal protein S17E